MSTESRIGFQPRTTRTKKSDTSTTLFYHSNQTHTKKKFLSLLLVLQCVSSLFPRSYLIDRVCCVVCVHIVAHSTPSRRGDVSYPPVTSRPLDFHSTIFPHPRNVCVCVISVL